MPILQMSYYDVCGIWGQVISMWSNFGELLFIENMDKRKMVGL
jgi:hypothetical protein